MPKVKKRRLLLSRFITHAATACSLASQSSQIFASPENRILSTAPKLKSFRCACNAMQNPQKTPSNAVIYTSNQPQ